MATLNTTGYYIYKGFVTRSQLLAQGVNIKRFPTQSDQTAGRLWIRPGNEADLVHPSALVDSISGRRFPYGGAVFKWPMMGMSPKMVRYMHETYFDFNWYADLTVQTFNRANGDWEVYWVTARWPDYTSEAELSAGGYNNFQINFVNGIIAPDGTDLVIDGHASGNFQIGSSGTFSLTISNSGDSVNFDPIYVNYELPSELVYESYGGLGWDLFWSTDGITYFDIATVTPIPTSLVLFIRLRYIYELNPAESVGVSVNLRPNTSGISHSTFTVSTAGDNGVDNKEIEFIVEIQGFPYTGGFSTGFGPSDSGFNNGFDSVSYGVSTESFTSGFSNGFGAPET
jgi:hypothetical protein